MDNELKKMKTFVSKAKIDRCHHIGEIAFMLVNSKLL